LSGGPGSAADLSENDPLRYGGPSPLWGQISPPTHTQNNTRTYRAGDLSAAESTDRIEEKATPSSSGSSKD